ncbi:MAG TPA: dienelactone hydrolase family protein [Polyangia bacterium]|jgi:carboxymethylenebutenolidase|nr:dienelactone hydrolase family protein [Polyangia bacterium]
MSSSEKGPKFEHPSRRQVIVTALGTGFALAVRPVSAEVITTPADGLDTAEVKIPTASGDIPAYRAMPAKAKKKALPVVLVVHEIFGVHEHIKDICRRLAKLGYFAVAPELYARQGDVSQMTDAKEILSNVVSKVSDAQVISDLDATVAWAKTTGAADVGRLGITGFCWGGRFVWLYAAKSDALKAGVAWYGQLIGEKDDLHPKQPIDIAASIKAPVLGLYGGQDQGNPKEAVDQMNKALVAGGKASKRSEIRVYPDAGHAFLADYRPSYRQEPAEDGWKRMQAWFKKNGVA